MVVTLPTKFRAFQADSFACSDTRAACIMRLWGDKATITLPFALGFVLFLLDFEPNIESPLESCFQRKVFCYNTWLLSLGALFSQKLLIRLATDKSQKRSIDCCLHNPNRLPSIKALWRVKLSPLHLQLP